MTSRNRARVAGLLACWLAATAGAQEPLRFQDLAGWWSADPTFGGEAAHLALQFVATEGRPELRLSVPALRIYDYPLGTVTLSGQSLQTSELPFPLSFDPHRGTLTGELPSAIVPVYRIPVEFRRGAPPEKTPPRDWQAPRPRLLWSRDTGGSPVWAGIERDPRAGTLFVANDQGVVHALTREGEPRWTFDTGQAIRAQPRLLGRHLYVASDSGFLHKLHRDTGAEVWRAKVVSDAPPRIPTDQESSRWDRYGSSVVSDGRTLFIASRDGQLYALDAKTGRERWRVAAGDLMTATPALHDGLVIFADYEGQVRAVSARDGTPRWSYDAKLAVPGDLTVADGRVLVGSRSYELIALEAASGRELWKRYYWFSWIESPPVVRDGVVYTGSSDATQVYALALADGSLRWKTAVPGWSWQRTAVTDELVIAGTAGAGAFPGSRAGSLVALDRASGAIRWIHLEPPKPETVAAKKGWGFGAAPVAADGRVYAADLEGRVHAFELRPPAVSGAPAG